MNRRHFLQQSLYASAAAAATCIMPAMAQAADDNTQRFSILHTNDVHSHLEPFAMDGSQYQGLGGVAPRAALIDKIRKENEQVLLLDAGDIFQGTPYFNLYKGEPDIKAMSLMKYDAVTMGNHDFDAGLENYVAMMQQHASFPVVICNYDFTNTAMEGKSVPYKVFKKGSSTIGVLGVGIELKGLVSDNLYGNVKYLDPVAHANAAADVLKTKEGCDFIICLSHLGDKYSDNRVSDEKLALQTHNIDLIIGGHTHKFFDTPKKYVNKSGKEVIVNQVGWAGIQLGRLDYTLTTNGKKIMKAKTVVSEKNYED